MWSLDLHSQSICNHSLMVIGDAALVMSSNICPYIYKIALTHYEEYRPYVQRCQTNQSINLLLHIFCFNAISTPTFIYTKHEIKLAH